MANEGITKDENIGLSYTLPTILQDERNNAVSLCHLLTYIWRMLPRTNNSGKF